jgi:hypothetical protein
MIQRFDFCNGDFIEDGDGIYVRYADHLAEIEEKDREIEIDQCLLAEAMSGAMRYQCPKCKLTVDFGNDPPYLWCPTCYGFEEDGEEIALAPLTTPEREK